jgi:hypothetical protein
MSGFTLVTYLVKSRQGSDFTLVTYPLNYSSGPEVQSEPTTTTLGEPQPMVGGHGTFPLASTSIANLNNLLGCWFLLPTY